MDCAQALHLTARAVRLELGDLAQLPMPCILHWDLNHFVVLKRVKGQRIEVHDPARGALALMPVEVDRHFTGVALELTPTHAFQRRDVRRKIRLTELVGKTIGLKAALIRIFCFAIVLEALALAMPLINQLVIDEVLVARDESLLAIVIIAMLMLIGAQSLIGVVREWATISMSVNFNMQWTANVFHHLVRLPLDWFEKRHIGDISAKFDAINTIQHTLTSSILQAVLDVILIVGTLTMMLLYSPVLSTVAIIAAVFYGVLRWLWFGTMRKASEDSWSASTQENSHFLESLRGVLSLRANNSLAQRESAWRNLNIERRNMQLKESRLGMLYGLTNTAIGSATAAGVIWFGAKAVISGQFTIGMLVAYMSFQGRFSGSVSALIDKLFEYRMLDVYNERLADIVLTSKEGEKDRAANDFDSVRQQKEKIACLSALKIAENALPLEVCNLTFRYGNDGPLILNNVSFNVQPSEVVALVGRSGGGKSTLAKLILGLYTPVAGQVRVMGMPYQIDRTSELRSMIGVVLQEDQLFSGAILDNITCFTAEAIDHERVEYCAKLAGVHDEINALAMGYQTLVGEMGNTLSGGQKQRILIARALYKQPRFLLLDEATSHLDVMNETMISQTLRKLGLPILLIAHRPETIASADRVLELTEGGVFERPSFEKLEQ